MSIFPCDFELRCVQHYDVPDEIVILDQTDKPGSATDATLATHYRNGDGQNEILDEGNRSSDSVQSSINVEPSPDTEAVAARIDPTTEPTNHENVLNNNSIDRNDNKLGTEVNEKKVYLSSKCVASVASVADVLDKNNEMNEKEGSSSSKCVASVASVADIHDSYTATPAVLPEIPCLWCDYKYTIEFDLGNHLLARHRDELLKLPVGKGSMDNRIDYAVEIVKSRMAEQYEDEDAESNDDE